MLAVVIAILAKLVVILKLGLRSISKRITSLIFWNFYTATCFDSYNSLCFKIIDKANSKFNLKIKEALHINCRKPNLNTQQNHLAHTLSFNLTLSWFLLLLLFSFAFVFHLLFSLSLTLIIGSFYCLNYTSLLRISSQHNLYHIFLFNPLFSLSLCQLSASLTFSIKLRYYFISL